MKASTKLQYSMNCTLTELRAFICKLIKNGEALDISRGFDCKKILL